MFQYVFLHSDTPWQRSGNASDSSWWICSDPMPYEYDIKLTLLYHQEQHEVKVGGKRQKDDGCTGKHG